MNAPVTALKPARMRARLRRATQDVHEALHQAAPFATIADGSATRESYGETLLFLYRYHSAMAGWCAAGAEALGCRELGSAHYARLAALASDLRVLGHDVPQTAEEPARAGAFAAGVLYTVQGSTLGGKVIHRQLDTLLAGDEGRLFFKGDADDGRRWQLLCAALERQQDGLGLEEGARYAFERFASVWQSVSKN